MSVILTENKTIVIDDSIKNSIAKLFDKFSTIIRFNSEYSQIKEYVDKLFAAPDIGCEIHSIGYVVSKKQFQLIYPKGQTPDPEKLIRYALRVHPSVVDIHTNSIDQINIQLPNALERTNSYHRSGNQWVVVTN